MATPLLTAAATMIDRNGNPVVRLAGQMRVTVAGLPAATVADIFVAAAGPVVIVPPQVARVRIGGVPALSAALTAASGLHIVADQTRVQIG